MKFHGITPPVVTPLTDDHELDVVSYERSLNRMIAAGVGAFKTALNLMGVFDSAQMPEPVLPLEGENRVAIAQVLKQEGLL